jgi:hypothetical protein
MGLKLPDIITRFIVCSLLVIFSFQLTGCGGGTVTGGAIPSSGSSGGSTWEKTTLDGGWNGYEEGASSRWSGTFQESGRTFYFVSSTGAEWFRGTYSENSGAYPRELDLLVEDSSNSWYIGKTSYAIFKIENNTLSMAFFNPGVAARPSSFTAFSVRDFTQRLFVMKPIVEGTPAPAPVPTPDPNVRIPTPSDFNEITAEIKDGNLAISLPASSSTEAYLLLIYHSENPSESGNPVTIGGSFSSEFRKSGKPGNPLEVKNPVEDHASPGYSNTSFRRHLELMRKSYDVMCSLFSKGIYPRPLTRQELKARGALDVQGKVKTNYVGQQRGFWIIDYNDYILRMCTCQAMGDHCYVYVDNADGKYYKDMKGFARSMASYFDATIYPLVHQRLGSEWNPGIDQDPRIFIVLSATFDNAYFTQVDEFPQSEIPEGMHSNEAEAVYIDPSLRLDPSIPYVDGNLEFLEAVCGHEFTHLVRFNTKFVESYGGIPIDRESFISRRDQEISVNEGCAIFTENIILGRGISNNFPLGNLRAQNLESYLNYPERCPMSSSSFNMDWNEWIGIYETGFLVVQYMYEKMGYDSTARLNQADGRTGIASLRAAAGNHSFEYFYDAQALALILSGRTADPFYTFGGADLSGATDYSGTRLHQAWTILSNIDDYYRGIDVSQLLNIPLPRLDLIEWAPMYFRFFNMGGKSLNINISGLVPSSAGGGSVKAYFFYR